MGSFILFAVILCYRIFIFGDREEEAVSDLPKKAKGHLNEKYYPHITDHYKKKIEKRQQLKRNKVRAKEREVCEGLGSVMDSLKLFEINFQNKDEVHKTFMKLSNHLEENLSTFNERSYERKDEEVEFCATLGEQFSDLTYLVSGYFPQNDRSFAHMVRIKYVALGLQLSEIKTYDRLLKGLGLFMNIMELSYLNSESKNELTYLYNRTYDDFKAYQSFKKVNPGLVNKGLDNNGEADYILFREWLMKQNH